RRGARAPHRPRGGRVDARGPHRRLPPSRRDVGAAEARARAEASRAAAALQEAGPQHRPGGAPPDGRARGEVIRAFVVGAVLLAACGPIAQPADSPTPRPSPAAASQTAGDFDGTRAKAHVDWLADVARGGRYTGSPGYRDAAGYVADRFSEIGNAYAEGAAGVLVNGGATIRYSPIPRLQSATIPTLVITEDVANDLLAASGKKVSDEQAAVNARRADPNAPDSGFDVPTVVRMSVSLTPVHDVDAFNVVGLLRAPD